MAVPGWQVVSRSYNRIVIVAKLLQYGVDMKSQSFPIGRWAVALLLLLVLGVAAVIYVSSDPVASPSSNDQVSESTPNNQAPTPAPVPRTVFVHLFEWKW